VTNATPRLYLLYHELRPAGSNYSYVVDTKQFEQHADTFLLLRQIGAPRLWPEITFDDGHISNFEYALPILQSRALQAWFFITVGWTGQRPGYMGWNELRALHHAGQRIGAHGWSHTLLTHCDATQLHRELSEARLTLEDKLGTSITTMSLPGGRYNRRVLAACQQAGYTQIFTSAPRPEPEPAGFTVGRLNIRGHMSADWIAALFHPGANLLADLERQYKIKAVAKSLLGDRVYEKLWSVLNRKELDTDPGEPAAREDSAHHQ
jgi:peptidoglycan/xylan/chitin deacetylase (PgdA/CDA1 family)